MPNGYNSTQEIKLKETTVEKVIQNVAQKSAFQSVSTSVGSIGIGEFVNYYTLDDEDATWVGEGGVKPTVDGPSKVKMRSHKLAYTYLSSYEADTVAKQIAQSIVGDAPTRFSRTLDKTIAGLIASPAAADEFGSLANAESVYIGGHKDLSDAFGDLASVAGEVDAVVLSTAGKARLEGLIGTDGRPLLNLENNTLKGRPITTFKSPVAVGFIGDFATHSRFGVSLNPTVRQSIHATIVDRSGNVHNTFQENKIAYIVEAFYAWQITNIANFRKLTFDAPVAP